MYKFSTFCSPEEDNAKTSSPGCYKSINKCKPYKNEVMGAAMLKFNTYGGLPDASERLCGVTHHPMSSDCGYSVYNYLDIR